MARTIAKDHDRKRAQILANAAKVFASEGFDRASMAQLASACGISKANIYHYYGGKEALLFDLLHDYLKALRDEICTQKDADLSPEMRLRTVVTKILKHYQGANHVHQVQISSLSALPQDQQKVLRRYQRDLVTHVSDIIHANAPDIFGDDAGKLRAVTMSVFGMLNWYFMWNTGAGTQAREDYAEMIATLTLHGIRGL